MSDGPTEILVLMTTFGSESDAERVARDLIERGEVACAQLETSRVRSIYGWKGELRDEPEYLLRVKTSVARREAVVARIRSLHPYELPEIIWWRAGAQVDYCDWVGKQCRSGRA